MEKHPDTSNGWMLEQGLQFGTRPFHSLFSAFHFTPSLILFTLSFSLSAFLSLTLSISVSLCLSLFLSLFIYLSYVIYFFLSLSLPLLSLSCLSLFLLSFSISLLHPSSCFRLCFFSYLLFLSFFFLLLFSGSVKMDDPFSLNFVTLYIISHLPLEQNQAHINH